MTNFCEKCDFLIVGSGASGAVIAARLSENPDHKVVLLEAGGNNNSLLLNLPGFGFAVANNPRFNWGFESEPTPTMNNRKLSWLQGRVLGGSSSINGMIYTHGHSKEYDFWRQMGCEGWASGDVLPYFKKIESNARGESEWHGGTGPVKVRQAEPNLPICDAFIQAAQDEGFPILADMNTDALEGFGFYDINSGGGVRMSAAKSYLSPLKNRDNLHIYTNAYVLKVNIENNKASGVEYLVNGQKETINVDGEIIISAGAIKSPQLLMLSGIGPEDELKKHNIPIKVLSPKVGKTLQNHACYRPQYLCSAPVSASKHLNPLNALKAGFEYLLHRTGPLAESYAVAGGFFRTDAGLETPDAQVVLLSALGPTKPGGAEFKIKDLIPREHGFGLTIYQGSPFSHGSVSLRSADPMDNPRIDSGYFSDPRDMEVLKKAVKRMRNMMQQPAINKYISREIIPGNTVINDSELEQEIRKNGATAYHQCGSCAMGGNQDSVLDPELRVRGVSGLRVADASVIPRIPNAALHAPSLMIGEKASAMIKGYD